MSNYKRLAELSEEAANSEDAATLQVLKTMDSIGFKAQQLQTNLQSLYTESGLQDLYKGILDFSNAIVTSFTDMPKLFNLPIAALTKFGTLFWGIAKIVSTVVRNIKQNLLYETDATQKQITLAYAKAEEQRTKDALDAANDRLRIEQNAANQRAAIAAQSAYDTARQSTANAQNAVDASQSMKPNKNMFRGLFSLEGATTGEKLKSFFKGPGIYNIAGLALSGIGAAVKSANPVGGTTGARWGGALSALGSAASGAAMGAMFGPIGIGIGGAAGAIMGFIQNLDAFGFNVEKVAKQLKEAATEANNEFLQEKQRAKSLKDSIEKIKELESKQYDSTEAQQEYIDAQNSMAETYPELIKSYDEAGNAVIDLQAATDQWRDSLGDAKEAAFKAAGANYAAAKAEENVAANADDEVRKKEGFQDEQLKGIASNVAQQIVNQQSDLNIREAKNTFDLEGEYVTNTNGYSVTDVLTEIFYESLKTWVTNGLVKPGDINPKSFKDEFKPLIEAYNGYLSEEGMQQVLSPNEVRAEANTARILRSSVATAVNVLGMDEHNEKVVSDLPIIGDMVTSQLMTMAEGETFSAPEDVTNWLNENAQSTYDKTVKSLDKWYSSLAGYQQEQVQDLFRNKDRYTKKEFKSKLKKIAEDVGALPEQLREYIKDELYESVYTTKDFIKGLEAKGLDKGNTDWRKLSGTELEAAMKNADYFAGLEKQGVIGEGGAQNLLNLYGQLWGLSEYAGENKDAIQAKLTSFDDWSLSGLMELGDWFEETIGAIPPAINALIDAIPVNLNTEVDTYVSNTVKSLGDYEKAVENATKGMDISTAAEFAGKIGVELTDLDLRDGLFYYDDINKIDEAYFKNRQDYFDKIKERALEETRENYSEEIKRYQNVEHAPNSEEDFDELQEINPELKDRSILEGIYKIYTENGGTWQKAVEEYFAQPYLSAMKLADEALKQSKAKSALKRGDIKSFLDTAGVKEEDQENYTKQILEGSIPEELKEDWGNIIVENFVDTTQAAYEKCLDILEKGGRTTIQVDDTNRKALQDLFGPDLVADDATSIIVDSTIINAEKLREAIAKTSDLKTKQSLINRLDEIKHGPNIQEAMETAISSAEGFSQDVAATIANAIGITTDEIKGKYFNFDPITQQYKIIGNSLDVLEKELSDKGIALDKDKLQSLLDQSNREQSAQTLFSEVIKNSHELDEETIYAISKQVDGNYEQVKEMLTQNADGTYTANLSILQKWIKEKGLETNAAIQELIAEQFDQAIEQITGLPSHMASGFTSLAEMQKYVTKFKDSDLEKNVESFKVSLDTLFTWDSTVHAFTLTTAGLAGQVAVAAQELEAFEKDSPEYKMALQLMADTARQFASNIDISSFIGAENQNADSKAYQQLKKALDDYNVYQAMLGEEMFSSAAMIDTLAKGGALAVGVAQKIAEWQDRELSTEEVSAIYQNGLNSLNAAIESVDQGVGTVISQKTNEILKDINGITTQQIAGTNTYLITGIDKNREAINRAFYDKILKDGTYTVEQFNAVSARYFASQYNADTLSELSNAAEMSIEEFSGILTAHGIMMTEDFFKAAGDIIERTAGGKIRVKDFEAYAKMLGVEKGSDEYTQALSTYNNSFIELDKKVANNINDELKNLLSATPNSKVNMAYFSQLKELEGEALDQFNKTLRGYGAQLYEGILYIQDNASLVGIVREIERVVQAAGETIPNGAEELVDGIHNLLKTVADNIAKAIKGTLTNVEGADLKQFALNNFGIELNFTKTTEGLKLSTDQAQSLYNKLYQIDSLSGQIVFDALQESLEEAGQDCENISATLASIKRIQDELNDSSNKNNTQLREKLSLYEQIAHVQMNDPDQYNFMDRALPDYFQGPENYWNAMDKAFTTMDTAAQNGYIGISDFYNIVNEMNALAGISGTTIEFLGEKLNGDFTNAANLITKGYEAITRVNGEGAKISLEGFKNSGANFETGADMFSDGIDAALHTMAQSQIDMLDGMIAFLETVVAMEKLDTGTDDTLDFKDLFVDIDQNSLYELKDENKAAIDNLLSLADSNEEMKKVLTGIKIDGTDLYTIFGDLAKGTQQSEERANAAFAAMQSLWQMAKTGDFDIKNLEKSILDSLKQTGYQGEITIPNGSTYLFKEEDIIKINADKTYEYDGRSFDSLDQIDLYKIATIEDNLTDVQTSSNNDVYYVTGTTQIAGYKVRIKRGTNSSVVYTDENGEVLGSSEEEAIASLFMKYSPDAKRLQYAANDSERYEIIKDWYLSMSPKAVKVTIPEEAKEKIANASFEQIQNLANAIATSDGTDNTIITAAEKFGIKIDADVDSQIPWETIQEMAQLAGIDLKPVVMKFSGSFEGENGEAIEKILTEKDPTVNVTVNLVGENGGEPKLTFSGLEMDENGNLTKDSLAVMVTDLLLYFSGTPDQSGLKLADGVTRDELLAYVTKVLLEQGDGYTKDDSGLGDMSTGESIPQYTVKVLGALLEAAFTTIEGKDEVDQLFPRQGEDINQYTRRITALALGVDEETKPASTAEVDAEIPTEHKGDWTYSVLVTALTLLQGWSINKEGINENALHFPEQSVGDGITGFIVKIISLLLQGTPQQVTEDFTRPDVSEEDLKNFLIKVAGVRLGGSPTVDDDSEVDTSDLELNKRVSAAADLATLLLNFIGGSEDTTGTEAEAENLPDQIDLKDSADATADVGTLNLEYKEGTTKVTGIENTEIDLGAIKATAKLDVVAFTQGTREASQLLLAATEEDLQDITSQARFGAAVYMQNLTEQLNSGYTLGELDKVILEKLKNAIGDAKTSLGVTWGEEIDRLMLLSDATLKDQQSQISTLTNAFKDLDPANIVTCADAMEKLVENAQEAINIDWDAIVDGINKLYSPIEGENTIVSGTEELIRKIVADVHMNYPDNMAQELITNNRITRWVLLMPNMAKVDAALQKLSATVEIKTNETKEEGDSTSKGRGGRTHAPSLGYPGTYGKVSLGADAKGNVALSKGTLMGELGPELYVTGGHYYVAGQNGAEMVNLPDDAIVFNHLQTKRLLSTGSAGRGTPVTNEKKAVAHASGNAKADASSTLNTLKQIRSMWQSLLNMSMKDFAQLGGSGGGGGGGGNQQVDAGFLADLERWYNLLQQIARLETKINYEEKLRSKISSDLNKNGVAYYESQKRSLTDLNQQLARNRELSVLQKDYYDKRREDLENSSFGKIFTFTDEGLMQFNDSATLENGDVGGARALLELMRQNPDGSAAYTAKEQYELLQKWGFGGEMEYDDSGNKISLVDEEGNEDETGYTAAVEAFWNKMEGWKSEMGSLYDSYNDLLQDILDEETARNQILQEMVDNQLDVEQKVLVAIVDSRQRTIDELQKERNAIEQSASKFIDGLSEQLDKEQQRYQNQQDNQELTKMQRQLAILQRSGGSASQITNLQNQIQAKQQEMYFNSQQEQIDAIQQASDLELERLDAQINLMTETLAYEKEHGLLWKEVYRVMGGTAKEITDFITGGAKGWFEKSPEQFKKDSENIEFAAEKWVAYREDENNPVGNEDQNRWAVYEDSAKKRYEPVWDEGVEKAKKAYQEEYEKSADPNKASDAADAVFADLMERLGIGPSKENGTSNSVETSHETTTGGGDAGGNGGGSSGGGSSGLYVTKDDKSWERNSTYHWKTRTWSDGSIEIYDKGSHNKNKEVKHGSVLSYYCDVCGCYMGQEKIETFAPQNSLLPKYAIDEAELLSESAHKEFVRNTFPYITAGDNNYSTSFDRNPLNAPINPTITITTNNNISKEADVDLITKQLERRTISASKTIMKALYS